MHWEILKTRQIPINEKRQPDHAAEELKRRTYIDEKNIH